jgi:hypothetical protein
MSLDLGNSPALAATEFFAPPVPNASPDVLADATPDEQAAAALVHLSGASSLTVQAFVASVPANLAAASALVSEFAARTSVSTAALGSLYTLMDQSAALALTRD